MPQTVMTPIVTPDEMQAIDAAAPEPIEELIERAARQVARHARQMLGGTYGRRVAVIAGPGNNGADARVAAGVLDCAGVKTRTFDPQAESLPSCDLVIDGAFGTGLARPYRAPAVSASTQVLAVDIPSGVDGLIGTLLGEPLCADRTVTFGALKPGLLLHPGAGLAGDVRVCGIGLDVSGARAHLMTETGARGLVPRRGPTDHKWSRAVWVIGGSTGMLGAPLLAAEAALRSGAGSVRCSLPGQIPPSARSEIVFVDTPAARWHDLVVSEARRFGAIVVGCGLGRSQEAAAALAALIGETPVKVPIVIDGDALRLLGRSPSLRQNVVLTPHDGEYEALFGSPPAQDRFGAARALAGATGATVLLKGPLTIVADPQGSCVASSRGDERLATAGSGDVLAGVVGSFLAGGIQPLEAAGLAAWVHGDAGHSQPSFGMVASDLLRGLPVTLSRLAPSTDPGASDAID